MKRASAVAIALLCAACGSSPETTPKAGEPGAARAAARNGENEAPTIESAMLEPNPAGAGDSLSLDVHTLDAEQDRLHTTVEWYRNGELDSELRDAIAPAGSFSRGDRVYAIVTVSDAWHDVTRQTAALEIGNSAPRIRSVMISPAHPTGADLLEAQTNAQDADGDSIEVSYRWHKNGELIASATGSRLGAGGLHRGDKVFVEASASDGKDASPWVSSPAEEVANASPAITSQPSYEMGPTGVYSYGVAAVDPDGDAPLRFELLQGPPGMAVDDASGVVTWTVPQDAKGNNPIEVAVTDGYGGRTTQRWVLSVDWNEPPASPSGNGEAKRAAEPRRGDEEIPAKRAAAPPKTSKTKTPKPAKVKSADEDDTDQDQGEETEEEEF